MPLVFQDATRKQTSLLARAEGNILEWLARHTPSWINSDHLTLLGLLAMFLAGVFYALSPERTSCLHAVNACLLLNWLGDSLDGTLARFRNRQRPRYGFYVDHIVDSFGALFLIGGLAVSGYLSERVALLLLIAFYMLSINAYLAAYTIGTFRISFGAFSPTELRALLVAGNLALINKPEVHLLGRSYRLFDVGGTVAIVGMVLILVVSTIRNTRALYQMERF